MKKPWIAIHAVFAAAAIAVAAGFAVNYGLRVKKYEEAYEQSCRSALFEVSECLRSIDTALSKGMYARSDAMMLTLSNEIWRQAELAKRALSSLPASDIALDKTSGFLSQVGAFCFSLSKKAVTGGSISDEDRQSLSALSGTATQMSSELSALYDASTAESFFEATPENLAGFASGLSDMESALPSSPTLIYDGPYSDHISRRVPLYALYGVECSEEDVFRAARQFFQAEPELIYKTEDPDNPLFCFGFEDRYLTVTGRGGHLLSYYESFIPGEGNVSGEDAVVYGSEYLRELGYTDMTASYRYCAGGICYINYAFTDGETVYYPDLIQVGVSLDDGHVTFFNARGYLNNHGERGFSHTLTEAQAAEMLSLPAKEKGRLCVIPSQGENELLCWEFLCADENGTNFLFYINAETGIDEVIFILIEDENGKLTV